MAGDLISPVEWKNSEEKRKAEQFAEYVIRDVPLRFQTRIKLGQAVERWIGDHAAGDGLYLTGSVGTGKTHTAFEVLMRLREARKIPPPAGNERQQVEGWGTEVPHAAGAKVWRATTLLDALRPGVDDARKVVNICQRVGLLLLDDIGAEKPSDWTQERLYEVIDERYVNQRPVIVTSNVPPKALAEWVGERTASRLAQMCTVVPLLGSDRRRSS